MSDHKDVVLVTYVQPEMKDKFIAICKKRDLSASQMIRRMIVSFMEKQEAKKQS
jgi:hypothetical protein